ncbi:MAG: cardiolipin synthase, partial [Clostridia bacterium]
TLHTCESIKYFDLGEKYFDNMLNDIKNAKKYIFLEYFIISKGKLWDELFCILKEKVKEGIEVYIITDEIGSIVRYPKNFKNDMKKYGIHLNIFNPITPVITSYINYRDHRKITVIDGEIAYSGGVNIGDEYINKEIIHGHWKDTGIRITGSAINNYVIMFISSWNLYNKIQLSINKYINHNNNISSTGYIIPYCDGPNDKEKPAETIYMNVINTAKDYVYITTPYLILDNEMITSLKNAAMSGVDVRIITPHIGDKWFVHAVTRSFYSELLEAGVKIYEYKPGFIHSKTFVSDDEVSIIGTINLDFRSLYLHYECASYTYKTGVESDVKNDFILTQNKSIEININESKYNSFINKIIYSILRLFAPIM